MEQHSSLLRADGVQGPRAPFLVLSLAVLPNQAMPVLCAVQFLEFIKWEFILSQDTEGFDPPQELSSAEDTDSVLLLYIYLLGLVFFSHQTKR